MRDRARSGGVTRAAGLGLLCALSLSACYQTIPLATNPPPVGTRVAARLTPQGSAEMAPWIGAGAAGVEGVVISTGPARWELSMLRVDQVAGTDVLWNREVVAFPASSFGTVTERRLNQQRSFLAAGVIGLGAILLGRVFATTVFDGGGGGGGGTDPPQ